MSFHKGCHRIVRGPAGRLALLLGVCGILSGLIGCSGGSVVSALAAMDPGEVEVHPASREGQLHRPARPSLVQAYSALPQGEERGRGQKPQRLESASLVQGTQNQLEVGSVVPYLRSSLDEHETLVASGEGQALFLAAQAPSVITEVTWVEDQGESRSVVSGLGRRVARLKGLIQPGDKGKLIVKLQRPAVTASSSTLVKPREGEPQGRFTLSKVQEAKGKVVLMLAGTLKETDRPEDLEVKTIFGRSLPVHSLKAKPSGIKFVMASDEFSKAWIVSLPEMKESSLTLPVDAKKPLPAQPMQVSASLSFIGVAHEDPNKMRSEANSPA